MADHEKIMQPRMKMGQVGISDTSGPKVSTILTNPIVPTMNRFLLYHQDNEGFTALNASHPHLVAKLEYYTLSWSLAGKYIIANKNVLQDYIQNTRELMRLVQKPPISLPDRMTLADFKVYMEEFLTFLEEEILPLTPDAPAPKAEAVHENE